MARRRGGNLRYAFLAIFLSMVLWAIAHGGSTVEREYDLPVVFDGLPDDLVIVDQSTREINVRLRGSTAAFRNAKFGDKEYVEHVAGAKPGQARYEVDDERLDPPRGLQVVGLSPSEFAVRFERRGRKNVKVRADVQGEPAEGYKLGAVTLDPARVWLTGARSRVLRVSDVATEPIDVTGLQASEQRQVKLNIGTDHVWAEDDKPVTVKIDVQPLAATKDQAAGKRKEGAG